MAHLSEAAKPLEISRVVVGSVSELQRLEDQGNTVWLFVLPSGRTTADSVASGEWVKELRAFATGLGDDGIVCILTAPQDAAETLPLLTDILTFQLWVAVKLQPADEVETGRLKETHAALLVLSRYSGSLRHTKTRIAYSYCPYCDKTTKDYGGKKHTYHEYGTLMSDVWRDIEVVRNEFPQLIAERLGSLFGLSEYHQLKIIDLRGVASLQPADWQTPKSLPEQDHSVSLPSQLVNGDSLTELRQLSADSVDFCFADPPYNLDKHYDIWDDALDVNNYHEWCSEWIHEMARVVRPGGTCAVLNIPGIAVKHFHQLQAAGLTFQNWIVWEGLSLPVRMIMPAHYSIVCFSKGQPRRLPEFNARTQADQEALQTIKQFYCVRQSCLQKRKQTQAHDKEWISDLWWDIHRLKHNSRRVDHPCQLPPALMNRLIAAFTNPGEIVLDPFNGAGTTSLCAELMGRRYFGIELSEKYHEIALARHNQLQNGADPFSKGTNVPKSKNSKVKRIGGGRYQVSKKTLQLEVKRIAELLKRLPTRDDIAELCTYPLWMYDEYFISWGEVCAAARTTGMTETRTPKNSKNPDQRTLFD